MSAPSFRHRAVAIAATAAIAGLLAACSLVCLGISTRAIVPPDVLIHNQAFWVGDLCRAYLNSPEQAAHGCAPAYTVDLVLDGYPKRHYTLLRIPHAAP
jgi:hypothetical protein